MDDGEAAIPQMLALAQGTTKKQSEPWHKVRAALISLQVLIHCAIDG